MRVFAQGSLHLAKLHAVASHLHLVVHASEKLQVAVGQVPNAVAGTVEPCSRLLSKRIRHERQRRLLRLAKVTAGHSGASHAQLAGNAQRNGPQELVQDVGTNITDWPPDWHTLA